MNTGNTRTPAFAVIFLACGVWLIGLGLYFVFLRPALLPEDLRYMGATLREIQSAAPRIERWLRHVFVVMGGFMIGAGMLTIHVMRSSSRARTKRSLVLLVLVGLSTVGAMSVVNFQLDSDFKWILLIPALLWTVGLVLYLRHE